MRHDYDFVRVIIIREIRYGTCYAELNIINKYQEAEAAETEMAKMCVTHLINRNDECGFAFIGFLFVANQRASCLQVLSFSFSLLGRCIR